MAVISRNGHGKKQSKNKRKDIWNYVDIHEVMCDPILEHRKHSEEGEFMSEREMELMNDYKEHLIRVSYELEHEPASYDDGDADSEDDGVQQVDNEKEIEKAVDKATKKVQKDFEAKLKEAAAKIMALENKIAEINKDNYGLREINSDMSRKVKEYEKEDFGGRIADLEKANKDLAQKAESSSAALVKQKALTENKDQEISSLREEIEALRQKLAQAESAARPSDVGAVSDVPVFENGKVVRQKADILRSTMFTFHRYDARLATDGSSMEFRENVGGKCVCKDGEIRIHALGDYIPFTGTTTYEAFRGPGSVITVKLR